MELTYILIGLLFLLEIFFIYIIIFTENDIKKSLSVSCLTITAFILGMLIISIKESVEYSSKKYNYNLRIETELVNDSIIKLDTLYIITRK